jgi:hypothetical protein
MEQPNVFDAGQQDFNLPHDVVTLPTGGIFYKSKKKSIKVGYLTANDENLLVSLSQMGGDNLITSLLRNKIYERELRPEELLESDIQAILIFLRNTSFGPEYTVTLADPKTDKKFEYTFLLDELNLNKCEYKADENGVFTTTLPKTGSMVKLRPLTFSEVNEINRLSEQYPTGRVAPIITWRLMKQIVEVEGNSSQEIISQFINQLPIMDSKYIRNFLRDNTPSLDLRQTVKAPSGELVKFNITFGAEFFLPFF